MSDSAPQPESRPTLRARIEATRSVTIRDFLIFQLKLLLDGLKDVVVFNLSLGAVLLDLLAGKGRQRRLFYGLMELSERFDLWLNLHGPASRSGETRDGLFGVSPAGNDTLLGTLELWTRGGDEPRSERRAREASHAPEGAPEEARKRSAA